MQCINSLFLTLLFLFNNVFWRSFHISPPAFSHCLHTGIVVTLWTYLTISLLKEIYVVSNPLLLQTCYHEYPFILSFFTSPVGQMTRSEIAEWKALCILNVDKHHYVSFQERYTSLSYNNMWKCFPTFFTTLCYQFCVWFTNWITENDIAL